MHPPTRYPYRPRPQITRLPSEMVQHIFRLAVTSADNYNHKEFLIRYKIRTAIRLVCRPWNQLVISAIHLWTRFAFDVTTRESRYPSVLEISLWLQRSGGTLPIDILVAMPADRSLMRNSHIRGVFNFLSSCIDRWDELWFYNATGVEGFPSALPFASNLTRLTINAGILDEDAISTIGPSFRNFRGRLRVLNIEVVTFDWIVSWTGHDYEMQLSGLESLTMQYEGWMQGVWHMFSETQDSLEFASIEVDGHFSHSVEYHTFAHDISTLALSRLRHLQLDISDGDLDIFSHLEMENLEVLDVSIDWPNVIPRDRWEIMPVLQFIESGLHLLRSCTIRCDRVRSSWITIFFRNPIILNITIYKIFNVSFGSDTNRLIELYVPPVVRDRMHQVLERNSHNYTVGWSDIWDRERLERQARQDQQ